MLTGRLIGFHDLEPIELYVEGLGKDTAGRINDLLNKATRIEVDQRLADVSTLLEFFSVEQAPVEIGRAPTGPTPEHQFLKALEMAYSFAPDGNLPDNVRATLIAKSQELGIGRSEAELYEKDFRARLGLSQSRGDRVVSATAGSALKTGDEKDVGTLVITSEPEMATVSVDGMERGKTPLTIDRIGAGNRTIRLKMDGFFPVSRIERINPDEETKIHVILEHQTGSIKVSAQTFSDAYPARFYLDGKLMGRLPMTVEDVTAGTHTYRLEADHHQEATGNITVTLDEEGKLDETLKPLPGIVTLRSTPPGAVLWIDGRKSKLKTDVRTKIPAGKRTITFKLDSYVDITNQIEILPGRVLEEQFRLIKNQGKINVVSVPEGAEVWMDGKNTLKRTDCILEVLAGEHELVLILDGYKKTKKMVSIEPEGFTQVEYRLKKAKSAAASGADETHTQGRYADIGNNIVKDTKTGLEWLAGPDKDTTWEEAKSWVFGLKTGGGGWRMPTLDELEAIYEKGDGDWNMVPTLLKNTGVWVWSGETKDLTQAGYFSFGFYGGGRHWGSRESAENGRGFAVRPQNDHRDTAVSVPTAVNEADGDGNFVADGNGILKDSKSGFECVARPFGLEKGMSLKDIGGNPEEVGSGIYRLINAPKPHSAFEAYIIKVAPKGGLCWIKAVGKDMTTSSYGLELRNAFREMERKLATTYGKHKTMDFLMTGSIWNEQNEWMMGLIKKERILMAIWESTEGSSLPSDLKQIGLIAKANAQDNGYVAIEYSFINIDSCEAELAEQEDQAL